MQAGDRQGFQSRINKALKANIRHHGLNWRDRISKR